MTSSSVDVYQQQKYQQKQIAGKHFIILNLVTFESQNILIGAFGNIYMWKHFG